MKLKVMIVFFLIMGCIVFAAEKKVVKSGKLFYRDGVTKYIGEIANGQEHGKGTLFDTLGKKIYEGEFKNGVPNGKGKMYDEEEKVSFEGEIKDGLPTDNGVWAKSESSVAKEDEREINNLKGSFIVEETSSDSPDSNNEYASNARTKRNSEDVLSAMIKDVMTTTGKYSK